MLYAICTRIMGGAHRVRIAMYYKKGTISYTWWLSLRAHANAMFVDSEIDTVSMSFLAVLFKINEITVQIYFMYENDLASSSLIIPYPFLRHSAKPKIRGTVCTTTSTEC